MVYFPTAPPTVVVFDDVKFYSSVISSNKI